MKENIIVFSVEDDSIYRKLIHYKIGLNEAVKIESFPDAKSLLKETYRVPNILILDLNLPDLGGLELVSKFQEILPNCYIIVLSSQEKIETVIDVLKSGVYDYIVKDDFALDRLWNTVNNAIKQIINNHDLIEKKSTSSFTFDKYIKGSCTEIKELFLLLEKTVNNNIPVEITGETGSGKELVAKAIHYNSPKKHKPFIALNVAAFPKELIESELFGYEKGAFTNAIQQKLGKLEEANGGTLFLDEISEMDVAMQVKLLRAIQEMEISRIGSNKIIKLNFRIIIASHKNLLKEVKDGRFREDLYYRLLGMKIELPPLRKRGNDIIILANYFLEDYCKQNKVKNKSISEQAKELLLKYKFPGNVRELKAIIETAYILSEDDTINVEDIRINQNMFFEELLPQKLTLEDYTIKIIAHHLKKNKNNVLKTAKELDIGKTTIYRFIKEGKLSIK